MLSFAAEWVSAIHIFAGIQRALQNFTTKPNFRATAQNFAGAKSCELALALLSDFVFQISDRKLKSKCGMLSPGFSYI